MVSVAPPPGCCPGRVLILKGSQSWEGLNVAGRLFDPFRIAAHSRTHSGGGATLTTGYCLRIPSGCFGWHAPLRRAAWVKRHATHSGGCDTLSTGYFLRIPSGCFGWHAPLRRAWVKRHSPRPLQSLRACHPKSPESTTPKSKTCTPKSKSNDLTRALILMP